MNILRRVLIKYDTYKYGRFSHRGKIAYKYLSGEGIEIGALHEPTRVNKKTKVKYLDIHSKEASIKRFPYLDPTKIVEVDIIDNGFELNTVSDNSQNFIIANHVLEHSPNPLKTIHIWSKKIGETGNLFIAVPELTHCFDSGREVTSLNHMIEDFQLYNENESDKIIELNRKHLNEFITISRKNMTIENGEIYIEPKIHEIEEEVMKTDMEMLDIHYHTFTKKSYHELLYHFCQNINDEFKVKFVKQYGGEIIGIIGK